MKNTTIGFDVRMAEHTGIGRYIRGIVSGLAVASPPFKLALISNKNSKIQLPPHLSNFQTGAPVYSLQEQFAIPKIAGRFDCLHVPHYNAPVLWRKKMVITIHDLIHVHFAKYLTSPFAHLYRLTLLPYVVRRADHIIAVSEYTKNDLVETFRINPAKVTVIYHGVDPAFLNSKSEFRNKTRLSKPYFLYVGLLKAHKNIGILLEAFRHLKKKMQVQDLQLVLVGMPDLKQPVVRRWLNVIQNANDVSLITRADDHKLRQLYQDALALVQPSLCEGFGFPLIEAMATRLSVIAAQTSSIPEVLGQAGLYFDPNSVVELEHRMEKIYQDAELRERLASEGKKRVQIFNWQTAALKTIKAYESIFQTH